MDERFEYIFSGKARMVKKFEYNVAKRQYITIAGCHVFQGRVEASGGTLVKVFRAGECIAEDSLKSLKFHRDNVELIEEGSDCGIALANFGDFEPDDILECYSKKILPKTEEWLLGYIEKNRERTIREEFPEIS